MYLRRGSKVYLAITLLIIIAFISIIFISLARTYGIYSIISIAIGVVFAAYILKKHKPPYRDMEEAGKHIGKVWGLIAIAMIISIIITLISLAIS